ncbi:unnamed protein product [Vicia faba]|uniref:Uncharacterized protein n=1 Tax=Vicia faba TaxID=3906 RepID=A0AAV1AE83_VICFA|nr:unnamed protein product [Vicia faba]
MVDLTWKDLEIVTKAPKSTKKSTNIQENDPTKPSNDVLEVIPLYMAEENVFEENASGENVEEGEENAYGESDKYGEEIDKGVEEDNQVDVETGINKESISKGVIVEGNDNISVTMEVDITTSKDVLENANNNLENMWKDTAPN